MAMLDINGLSISFGGLHAVDDFNVTIEEGQLYGLIGPNGAGKTTVFNLLTGVYKPTEGVIRLNGQDNTIRFRKSKNVCRMSVYPKEIWKEIPKGTTDEEALGWFRDKAQLIADLLRFSGWKLKN